MFLRGNVTSARLTCEDVVRTGWPGDRVVLPHGSAPRKVRAPQGRVVANSHPGQPAGQCHREETASPGNRGGKGETVVQETTSGPGDRTG